jgi:hypothetical protein
VAIRSDAIGGGSEAQPGPGARGLGDAMSTAVDPAAFRRLLRERCMTAEELRRALGLSSSTLAKLNRGEAVSDAVFRRVVLELRARPVVPLAQELVSPRLDEVSQGAAR